MHLLKAKSKKNKKKTVSKEYLVDLEPIINKSLTPRRLQIDPNVPIGVIRRFKDVQMEVPQEEPPKREDRKEECESDYD